MALRWRNYGTGELLCAATHPELPDDSYIDDALHYKLAVELCVVIPDENEAANGKWYWLMKLWVDDARPAPPGWTAALNYNDAVALLAGSHVVEISLDYDLNLQAVSTTPAGIAIATSNDNAQTGYDVARWIEAAVADGRIPAPVMHCHSSNPIGQQLITAVIERMA